MESEGKWYLLLSQNNLNYKKFRRPKGSWLLRDDSSSLEVLEKHANLENTEFHDSCSLQSRL